MDKHCQKYSVHHKFEKCDENIKEKLGRPMIWKYEHGS
jgi:hypothetical protein